MVRAVADAVSLDHVFQIMGGKVGAREGLLCLGHCKIVVSMKREEANALQRFVPLVYEGEIFANRFLARQVEHSSANILNKIRPFAFFRSKLRMLRRRFDIKKLA